MSTQPTLAFIGTGNMARAIIGGLLSNGYPAASIWTTGTQLEKLADLKQQGLHTTTDNNAAVAAADIVILAVKPQILKTVAQSMAEAVQQHQPLIVSVAAGVLCNSLEQWLGGNIALVRCMPNTPALLQAGATGLFATESVTSDQRALADTVLAAVGSRVWVDKESQLDAVTAVSGSGPAYFFLLMEAMQSAGQSLGLAPELTDALVLQTALGAATMACDSDVDVAELRRRVTSPNGTTQAALESFERDGLRATVDAALQAAAQRSVTLEQELCQ